MRGRRLATPEGLGTRPMLARVREALFSTIAPWLPGAAVLDLFAGTGSLGLEALSRGAASARFVERDGRTFALLKQNVEALGVVERSLLVRADAVEPASWGSIDPASHWPDIVFLDPPYPLLREKSLRARLLGALELLVAGRLAPEGVVVFHAARGEVLEAEFSHDLVVRGRHYGTNTLWYVQRDDGSS